MILLTQISRYSANKRISAPENLTPALFTIIVFMMNLCYKRISLPIRFMGRLNTAGRYPGLRTRAASFPSPATFLSVHGRKGGRAPSPQTELWMLSAWQLAVLWLSRASSLHASFFTCSGKAGAEIGFFIHSFLWTQWYVSDERGQKYAIRGDMKWGVVSKSQDKWIYPAIPLTRTTRIYNS